MRYLTLDQTLTLLSSEFDLEKAFDVGSSVFYSLEKFFLLFWFYLISKHAK